MGSNGSPYQLEDYSFLVILINYLFTEKDHKSLN
jgi:hypothetical protein